MERIDAAPDKAQFIELPSGRKFIPWGNNYGNHGRLMEDFWADDWTTLKRDFQYMRSIGANVVRIHLQLGKFMAGPNEPRAEALGRLSRLLVLAKQNRLYLDLTGLACYRYADVPRWFDQLSESARWDAQANFWKAVAAQCNGSPAVFCYDLINEPVVAGGKRKDGEWYTGELGGLNFLQFINLDQAGRPREEIARRWVRKMVQAIHANDRTHLITVGMLPSTPAWGLFSGFDPKQLAPDLDFISVHIYPEKGKLADAMTVLKKFRVGKPVLIEETFPLTCSQEEERRFLLDSKGYAAGWIGHYNGETIPELESLRQSGKITPQQSAWLAWEQLFKELGPVMAPATPESLPNSGSAQIAPRRRASLPSTRASVPGG
jgi:hypothetical protein